MQHAGELRCEDEPNTNLILTQMRDGAGGARNCPADVNTYGCGGAKGDELAAR